MSELDANAIYSIRRHGDLVQEYGASPIAVRAAIEYFDHQLNRMKERIAEAGEFLMGEKISIADILFMSCLDAGPALRAPDPRIPARLPDPHEVAPGLCGDLSAELWRARRAGGLSHAGAPRRHPRSRPDDDGLGSGGDHDARRPGRGRDQDRVAGGRHHAAIRRHPPRHVGVVPVLQPVEALALRRPQDRRGARHRPQARHDRGRAGAELPPGRDRAHGARRGRRPRTQARHNLRLDQRVRRDGALCASAGL